MNRFFSIIAAICLVISPSFAIEIITIGQDGQLDWSGKGTSILTTIDTEYRSPLDFSNLLIGNNPGNLVEFTNEDFPSSILPRLILEGENVSDGTISRGGVITAPNVFDFSGTFSRLDLKNALEEMILIDAGGEQKAFQRKDLNSLGILVILNMGGRFGVNRIRFYPRNTVQFSPSTPFQSDFLHSFELFTNDGLSFTKEGSIIWQPLLLETENKDPVVEVILDPPQYIQSIRLRSTTPVPFEIDELEVFGKGFLADALYISDIFDAHQPAIWGKIRWLEEVLGNPKFSNIQIRTRTGSDSTPFVLTRVISGLRDAEEVPFSLENPDEEMQLTEYRNLPSNDSTGRLWDPGSVNDDLVNWSPFSTPLPVTAANSANGIPLTSPNPRRYFQFQVAFRSNDLEAARVLRSLSLEVLTPAFADAIVGEVFPREVKVSTPTDFTFALKVDMKSANLRGFDLIEIATPSQVEDIALIEIFDADGQPLASHAFNGLEDRILVDDFQIITVDPNRFVVKIPFINQDDTLIKIHFQSSVLTYSTNFTASIQLSTEPGIAQNIDAGDAAELGSEDLADLSGTTVLSPTVLGGTLIDRISLTPNPFTPNGDGINDILEIHYNLLSLSAARPVQIKVYDLGGRLMRTIYNGLELNGRYLDKKWDGRNDQDDLVPPGMYILRITVNGDSINAENSRIVNVIY